MKKKIKFYIAVLLCVTFVLLSVAGMAMGCSKKTSKPTDLGNWTVISPDGGLKTDINLNGDGELTYSVKDGDVTAVLPSKLGFTIKQDDFRLFTVEGENTKRIKGSYENKSGKHKTVNYDCNELTLTLKNYDFYLDVIMRVYDDGYAFRYNIRSIDGAEKKIDVINEESEFYVPDGATLWAQPYVSINTKAELFAYENPYVRRNVNNVGNDKISMPMLYKVKGSETYSLISESELVGSGFYGSFLEVDESDIGTGKFKLVHNPASVAVYDYEISVPFSSPWRTGIVGDLKTVVESEMVEKLYDDTDYWKPEDYDTLTAEQKKTFDYDWVDISPSAWNWLKIGGNSTQKDYEMQKTYVDLAHDMGWKYTILDAGWDWSFDSAVFREFMNYADEKGIKVVVWCDSLSNFAYGNTNVLQSKLDYWASFGIDGIKIDFFDGQNALESPHRGEDKQTIAWYETIFQECAKRKMIVNVHGCNKPTGIRRKYPNVINYEGIKGNESLAIDSTTTVNSLFTRAIVGPTDFTPVVLPTKEGRLTVAHQVALAVLFESGSPSMADVAETYYYEMFNELFKSVPARHDDTVFLSGEPDDYYCAAIRSGEDWFVAAANSFDDKTLSIDLSFLNDGEYKLIKYTDADNANDRKVEIVKQDGGRVTKSNTLSVKMYENGGFVLHFKKIN